MSGAAGIDYSVWDHIYVSDDEDVTSPFVDTSSLFRMRHRVSTETYYMDDFYDSITKSKGKVDSKSKKMRKAISTVKMYQNKQTLAFGNKNMARLERMAEFQQRGDDLENNFAECKRRLEEAERHLKQLEARRSDGKEDEERDTELKKVQAVVEKLKEDQKSFGRLIREYRQEEKTLPWNVDTLSKEGFSKSVLNITTVADKETEEQKMEKQKTFVEKHTKEIKHFGMLHRWDDSQKYLSDNPHLVCEETANCLVVVCIDFEIDEKHALMEQVAHQAIVMKFILDLAETLKVDPRGCFRQFFSKIKTADQPYQDAFNRELESLKDRVRGCARIRMESTMKELEEEERQERLGPGGLDPVEVYQSLPKDMQKSFDDKNIEMLQEVMNRLSPEEAKYHLRRCIDSGLWVPESDEETNGEEDY